MATILFCCSLYCLSQLQSLACSTRYVASMASESTRHSNLGHQLPSKKRRHKSWKSSRGKGPLSKLSSGSASKELCKFICLGIDHRSALRRIRYCKSLLGQCSSVSTSRQTEYAKTRQCIFIQCSLSIANPCYTSASKCFFIILAAANTTMIPVRSLKKSESPSLQQQL